MESMFGVGTSGETKHRRRFARRAEQRARRLATLEIPPDVNVTSFSLHPDGKRLAVSLFNLREVIYQLEGFDQPESWLDHMLSR
jgi:hypothetical protein